MRRAAPDGHIETRIGSNMALENYRMTDHSKNPLQFGFPLGAGLAAPSKIRYRLASVAAKVLARQAEAAPDRPFVLFQRPVGYRRGSRPARQLAAHAGCRRWRQAIASPSTCTTASSTWMKRAHENEGFISTVTRHGSMANC